MKICAACGETRPSLPSVPSSLPSLPPTLSTRNAWYTCFCVNKASHPHLTLSLCHPSKPSPSPISCHPLTLSLPTQHQTFRPRAPRTVEATPVSSSMNHLLLAEAVILEKILNGDLFSTQNFLPQMGMRLAPKPLLPLRSNVTVST